MRHNMKAVAGVPWGRSAFTPGNHDGPGYTSSFPTNHNFKVTGPAPQPMDTAMGVHETGATTQTASDAALAPVAVGVVGGKIVPLVPIMGSGEHGRRAFFDDSGMAG